MALLRERGVPAGSFEDLHAFMQSWLGRTIRIEHLDTGAGSVCGLWVGLQGGSLDVIFADLSSPHWRQTVAHEWGHMLCGHASAAETAAVLQELTPLLPARAVEFALARQSFTDPQEQDAEAVGDAICLRLLASEYQQAQDASLGGFGRLL